MPYVLRYDDEKVCTLSRVDVRTRTPQRWRSAVPMRMVKGGSLSDKGKFGVKLAAAERAQEYWPWRDVTVRTDIVQ